MIFNMNISRFLCVAATALLLCACSYEVRPVKSHPKVASPGGLLYALPRTEICVDVTFGHYDTTGATFVKYANEMLSVNGKLGGYEIKDVKLSTRVVADPKHFYFVRPKGTSVQVDSHNLLRSIGLESSDMEALSEVTQATTDDDFAEPLPAQYNLYDRADTFYSRYDRPGSPSMIATKKDIRTLRQQAMAAAERIGQLQERRQQLLNGESETSYTPEGLRVLIQLIDRQEHQLQEQFVGRYVTETVRFVIDPKDEKTLVDSQTVVLFYFSPEKGIADSIDRGAMAVRCSLRCDNEMRSAARFVKFRVGAFQSSNMNERNTFKYRCSEQADVMVYSDKFTYQKRLPIAQFGPTIELPSGKFKALFDAHTGDLIYVAN